MTSSTRKPTQETEFDIWKLVKRSSTSNPYSLALRYRSDTKKTDVESKRLKIATVYRRRRRRPDSGTESDSSDSVLTSTTDITQRDNESYFKEDYDFDAEDPPEPPLYPHLVHKPGTFIQELYRKACKEFGTVRYSKIYKGLASEKIVMRRQRLCPLDVKACVIALMESYSIHTLDLGGSSIGPLGASYIAELLAENQFIKHLDLSDNNIETEGLRCLVSVVKQYDGLTTLDLSGNDLQEEDAEILRPLFTDTMNLKSIRLSHNHFREKGGKLIGQALALNDTLESLDLSWNHLRRQGAVKIVEAITNNSSLRVFNLSWNGLHTSGCSALAKALAKNTALTSLDIASNRIDDELLQKIVVGLKKNTSLKTLKIGQNPISPEAATNLLLFIHETESTGLNKLDLTDQLVRPSFLDTLATVQRARELDVVYGRVKDHDGIQEGAEERSLLEEDPVLILIEFGKMMGFRLIDLFATLDQDGSRSLDHEEIQTGLKMLNLPLSESCITILIQKLDSNLDGRIDFGELMSARTKQLRRSSKLFDARHQNVDVDETEEGRVRVKLRRLLKKKMSESQEFKDKVENMRKTLTGMGGVTKLQQELSGKTSNIGKSPSVLEDT